ncbi:unnamed protein product [Amoebophrya sp. A120]|nr:unnamed protein product [Amoebophrya sp. A120]|eukprot:GSA120T00015139001.1
MMLMPGEQQRGVLPQGRFQSPSAVSSNKLSAVGSAVMAEVKMAQMQFQKVQDLCWERCMSSSVSSHDCSAPSTPEAETRGTSLLLGGYGAGLQNDITLSMAETSCVNNCVSKFYQVAHAIAYESAEQAKKLNEWGPLARWTLTLLTVGGCAGLAYYLFIVPEDDASVEAANPQGARAFAAGGRTNLLGGGASQSLTGRYGWRSGAGTGTTAAGGWKSQFNNL